MPLRSPAALLAALLLLAAAVFTVTLTAAGPARSAEFTDAAGRRVELPGHIGRVMPAERNAEVLVFVLAPNKLAGRSRILGHATGQAALGWHPRSTPADMAETARRLRADFIIDAGTVTPDRAAFADEVMQLARIPYILVDDSFARMPAVLRSIGALLGVGDRGDDLGILAEHAITGLRGRLLIRPADTRPHVYYARGSDGLTTALPGSPAGAAIDAAGAINVAGPLGRGTEVTIRREQLLRWDPKIIIAENRRAYDALRHNRAWLRLSAVRHKRVYLEPSKPFGWIEGPAGVNRLIGLQWLTSVFYPEMMPEDLRVATCDFYDKFYRIKLTNAQIEAMVRSAGLPPLEAPLSVVGGPLVGLAAAAPPTLSSGSPVMVTTQSTTQWLPNMAGTGPTATCVVPTAPAPRLLPGMTHAPGASPQEMPPAAAPGGVPPAGRRGRPTELVPQ
jgi:iron complex transport system substrate-binding protein